MCLLEEVAHTLRALRVERAELGALDAGDGALWRLLAIVVLTCQVCSIELTIVVTWSIEKLPESRIDIFVIFGALHIMIAVPGEFSKDIPLLVNFGVLRHSSTFDTVRFERVKLSLVGEQRLISQTEVLVEVLLVVL